MRKWKEGEYASKKWVHFDEVTEHLAGMMSPRTIVPCCQRAERGIVPQFRLASAKDQLLCLRKEFDLSNAARPQLHIR